MLSCTNATGAAKLPTSIGAAPSMRIPLGVLCYHFGTPILLLAPRTDPDYEQPTSMRAAVKRYYCSLVTSVFERNPKLIWKPLLYWPEQFAKWFDAWNVRLWHLADMNAASENVRS